MMEANNKYADRGYARPESRKGQMSTNLLSMISRATSSSRNQYLKQIKKALQKIDNHKYEDIIGELFEKNGYTLSDNKWYDKESGDVDLVFEGYGKNVLMYNAFKIYDAGMPHIHVRVKENKGKDNGDAVGADYLIKMKKNIPNYNAFLMHLNLTDEFSDEAKTTADDIGIILINGFAFASLLVRYGIDVDMRLTIKGSQ